MTEQNESNKLLPEIDQAAYEQIREQANRLYCKAQRGYRGQQVTIHDTHSYWIMIATREFFTTNNQG